MTTIQHQRTASPVVRLTRRGRIVVVLLAVATVFAIFAMGRQSAHASDGTTGTTPVTQTTVQAGESLWTVSSRLWPSSDPRDGVAALVKANHLRAGAPLAVGAVLRVP